MRAAVAAALAAAFVLVAAGCGSSSTAATGQLGGDAVQLVPSSALAFVSADTNLDSAQWGTVKDLFGPIQLPKKLDYQRDVKPALGDEVNLAVLGIDNGKPEAVAIAKPDDQTKLSKLASMFDRGSEHYTVEQIGDWSVVADSADAFQAVRGASSGDSLADNPDYQTATSQLGGDALATAYATGNGVEVLPEKMRALVRVAGSPRWVAARLTAKDDAVRIDTRTSAAAGPESYKPTLLRDVPSGAILAVSFKNVNELLARVRAQPTLRTSLPPLVSDLNGVGGEGVLYVVPGAILPVVTLEVRPENPAAAATSFRAIATRLGNSLPMHVRREGAKVFLTTAPANLGSSGSLVDDKPFKDALAAADVPDDVTWLAYADVPHLSPLIQAFSALLGNGKQTTNLKLDKLGTLVAYGASTGSTSRLVVRITHA
jgi:hypothetical protein